MSRPDCAFAFAQARLQARLGIRPTAADWQRLRATRELDPLLQGAAATSMAPWVAGLSAHEPTHRIERHLRDAWRRLVDEVAEWQPQRWRPAVHWMRWLPDLPALQKLARGGRPQDWMREDPVLASLVALEPGSRRAGLRRTALAPLAPGFDEPARVAGAWLAHWRTLWPEDRPAAVELDRLVREVARHHDRLASLPSGASAADERQRFDRRLHVIVRRHPLRPVAPVAFLGLAALDMAALRGAIAMRALRRARAESS